MTVGKAQTNPPNQGSGNNLDFKVKCFQSIDDPGIRKQLASRSFFWLDLTAPTQTDIDQLSELFDFHPLALEDATHFNQRPKLDQYQDYVFMVFYGACLGDEQHPRGPQEVQMFISGNFLITIHQNDLRILQQQCAELDGQTLHSEQFLLYRVFDSLTDSFFPLLADIDDEIDELEVAVLAGPSDEQLQRLFALKRSLVAMRKVVTPQRDLFARSIDQLDQIPGLSLDERDYFRDIYDHLIRVSDLIDSYRDLLSGATDLYLSTVSNRQNEVMKQLAVVGTIFLPLTFITGFFGQNFGWMVDKGIGSLWSFLLFGVGSIVITCALLLALFKKRNWL